jgi:DNA transformation protein and related proteins
VVASVEFGSYLCEELSPLGVVSLRRMFGKTGVFCNGVMFAMVNDNELYLRVDSQNRDAFAEAASSCR